MTSTPEPEQQTLQLQTSPQTKSKCDCGSVGMAGNSVTQEHTPTTPNTFPPARGESQDEPLLPDDRPPSPRSRGRLRAVAMMGVAVAAVVVMVAGGALVAQYTRHVFHSKQTGAGVGVLVNDFGHDSDLLKAAHQAGHDAGVMVRVEITGGTKAGAAAAFTRLWQAGVKVFLVGGSEVETKALCQHIQHEGKEVLLVSPTAATDSSCPALLTLTPPSSAIITAEMTWVVGAGVTSLVPVVVGEEWQTLQNVAMKVAPGVRVAPPVFLQPHNLTYRQLRETLAAWPGAAVWIAVENHLSEVMAGAGHYLLGHLILLHTHPSQATALLHHPAARQAAEECAAVRVAWAGANRIAAATRRRLLATITPDDPLVAALAYDASLLSMTTATAGLGHMTQLKARMLAQGLPSVTQSEDNMESRSGLGGSFGGWVVRVRLVKQELLGKVIVQDSPWLLEGESWVEGSGMSWVVKENHAPTRLMTQEELQGLAQQAGCFTTAWVGVTAHDPLTHQAVSTAWPSPAIPKVMLVPNGFPAGFTVQVWCKGGTTPTMEVACRGATTHNDYLRCVTAMNDGQDGRRRVVRSLVTSHGYPVYYIYRQPGIFGKTYKKIKGFFKHEDFRNLIPQIGGCMGATGGCTFCFVFLLLLDVNVSPGVCYGACGVAVGGSCTTLLAKGIQYHMDHTVICSELFHQGRLPLTSYLVDAAYGSRLATDHPQALRGYRLLAAPLVTAMQASSRVSDVVEAASQPWVRHMEYQESTSVHDDILGCLITTLGLPFCSLLALFLDLAPTLALVVLLTTLRLLTRT